MSGHTCYHCKEWVEDGAAHDCWTTTEAALTADLSEDLQDAWERLRETAIEFGVQRIYASHHSIMFSRTSCYFFVRPKKHYLEVCVFLGRAVRSPLIHRVDRASKAKHYHILRITHRDEVEAPVTDWLREAYDLSDVLTARAKASRPARTRKGLPRKARPKPTAKASKTEAKRRKPSSRPRPKKPNAKAVSREP